ncbi:substrate-binding domain-containing protein [Rivularia sp. UHCC 0363]|uniref:substrate-binding domain-containing protein n=1 Tax=Rivularia sp. UHCC 0363 TaxID=3110244 RepID=UPI002B1FA902|nr:substrate-binding domain-containing protein [Rivularia sp. UHCC 0363]MEA5596936.1 substrate-binding domain-containing protein [Rivularia sp. UHCC 0363]
MKKTNSKLQNRAFTSACIIVAALGLAYAPIPGLQQTVVIVSGTELQAPLEQLEAKFEQENPNIKIDLKFQGSQDIVNKFIDQKNDFTPTVLIPASGELLDELSQRYQAQNNSEAFYNQPQPIAKTLLVAIAWSERGNVLFPNNQFSWSRVEQAMQANSWSAVGGQKSWGSFDFVITDPTRSNSAQASLNLWAMSKLNASNPNNIDYNNPAITTLFSTVKKSVYQPPRSTDILLQEFITRGPNDADVATVYESIALSRWQQSGKNQGKPYQIYYLNPTVETVATAAIVRQNVDSGTANAAQKFVDFLTQSEQQKVFVQYGFRPTNNNIDVRSVPNSPWSQNIPGAEINPSAKTLPAPNQKGIGEIQRLWQRTN